eukprot:Sspe_Gene.101968::Locus_76660_Transcript_1_1_Confidence_1.000_Length_522::g.101968::m.101968
MNLQCEVDRKKALAVLEGFNPPPMPRAPVLTFTGIGSFTPRVAFLAVKKDDHRQALGVLRDCLLNQFLSAGLEAEKKIFIPHCTIAKTRTPTSILPVDTLARKYGETTFGTEEVRQIDLNLMQSVDNKYVREAAFVIS